jgi:hypothetical protein
MVGIGFLCLFYVLISEVLEENLINAIIVALSMILLLFALISALSNQKCPIVSIPDVGTYKVGYVYIAGENVNLGIETKNETHETIQHYQFPKNIFNGDISNNSKSLVITEVGNNNTGKIKRLHFEPIGKILPEAVNR